MTEQQRNTILSRWRAGASQRQIARDLRLSRNTVQRILAEIDRQRAGVDTAATVSIASISDQDWYVSRTHGVYHIPTRPVAPRECRAHSGAHRQDAPR